MGVLSLASPQEVSARLEAIEDDLAKLQNDYEKAAFDWFKAKRDREKTRASAFLTAKGSIAARNAVAEVETSNEAIDAEAKYEALKAKVRVLETRATIGQSILRSQSRA